jgi:DNA polymerase-1
MSVTNLIIDGTNIEYRIFHVANSLNKGEDLNLTSRFLTTMNKLIDTFNPTNIYVAWDRKLTPHQSNFRKDLLDGQYKAGRPKSDNISLMFDAEAITIKVLESLGIHSIFPNILEADDVMAWISTKVHGDTMVVSVDKDLLQLIDERTSVWNLRQVISLDNFKALQGVDIKYFKLYKAIMGDKSDNISGLPGYGPVRSAKLATAWSETTVTDEYKQKYLEL